MTTIPATVTILDLGTGTLSSAAALEAQQITNGVATTIRVTPFQIASAAFTAGLVTPVTGGGTNATSLAAFRVLLGAGTSTIASSNLATTGLPLVGNGSAAQPSFQVLNLTGGGTNGTTQASAQIGLGVREVLAADRTYYVRTDGSDSNNGLTNNAAGAFLTPQKFMNTVLYSLDMNGKTVTCELTGAFTSSIRARGPIVGGGIIVITSTAGASITTTSENCIEACFGAYLRVNGSLTLSTVGSGSPNCLAAWAFGRIEFSGLTFGASLGAHLQAGFLRAVGEVVIDSLIGVGTIVATGNYTITGGGLSHMHVTAAGSQININTGVVVTLTGTPAFSAYFVGVTNGFVYAYGASYSGSATGQRYLCHRGGTIIVDQSGTAETFFPGNSTGVLSGGALYGNSDDTYSRYGIGAVKFENSASADTTTLDYYIEDTWTPVLSFGNGTTGITYSTQTGTLTRIGNRAFIDATLILTSKGSSTGTASISSHSTHPAALSTPLMLTGNNYSTNVVSPRAAITGTAIVPQSFSAGLLTNLDDTHFTNTTIVRLAGTIRI